jgi:hypothetical protein
VSALLALTDSAVQAVKDIVSSSEQVPETGDLRMVAERAGTQANFQVSVVPSQAEDDEEQGPVSSSNQTRPPSSTTRFSMPASSRTGSRSRSRTRSRSSRRVHLARRGHPHEPD